MQRENLCIRRVTRLVQRFVRFIPQTRRGGGGGRGSGHGGGVAVGDVLLPLAGVPLAVLLGVVLAVELPEGYGVGVVFIPSVELTDALFVFSLGI